MMHTDRLLTQVFQSPYEAEAGSAGDVGWAGKENLWAPVPQCWVVASGESAVSRGYSVHWGEGSDAMGRSTSEELVLSEFVGMAVLPYLYLGIDGLDW